MAVSDQLLSVFFSNVTDHVTSVTWCVALCLSEAVFYLVVFPCSTDGSRDKNGQIVANWITAQLGGLVVEDGSRGLTPC